MELYRLMSPEQEELRSERIAIMIHCGGLTEEEAEAACNRQPLLYGIVGRQEDQERLFSLF